MKSQIRLILIFLTFSNIAIAQDSLKRAVKLNFDVNYNLEPFPIKSIQKTLFYPSYFFLTKKKNWREIQLGSHYNKNKAYYDGSNTLNDFNNLDGRNRTFNFFINRITHRNFLRNRNSKLKFFYSFNTRIEFERSKHEPSNKTISDFYSSRNYFGLNFGLSTRIGYKVSNKVYFEFSPPISAENTFTFGKIYTENPSYPANLRNMPFIYLKNFNANYLSKEKRYNTFSFSVAYRF